MEIPQLILPEFCQRLLVEMDEELQLIVRETKKMEWN